MQALWDVKLPNAGAGEKKLGDIFKNVLRNDPQGGAQRIKAFVDSFSSGQIATPSNVQAHITGDKFFDKPNYAFESSARPWMPGPTALPQEVDAVIMGVGAALSGISSAYKSSSITAEIKSNFNEAYVQSGHVGDLNVVLAQLRGPTP